MKLTGMVIALVLTLGAAAGVSAAEFTEAELYFELNNTDGDLGIHASIDGGPYVELRIVTPEGSTILNVTARGRLASQGLTQLFLESAEPSFDELTPERFFRRFPEGRYEIKGTTSDGETFQSRVRVSHVMAAPPSNITVSGAPAAANCDAVPLPAVQAGDPVVIEWARVTSSHPTIGRPGPVRIVRYQFFVEQGAFKLAMDLPPTVTRFEIPAEILAPGSAKFEIIARTSGGNNTAVESCFMVE